MGRAGDETAARDDHRLPDRSLDRQQRLWTNLEGDTESTDTEYKHSGLTAGATRYYRVSAINAIGTGSTSDGASATTRKATFVSTENADGSTAVWMATLTVDEARRLLPPG